MPRVKWGEQYSVGVPSIDEQHSKIVSLLNQLHDGMMTGTDRITLGRVLLALIDYTTTHFTYEEELLARAGYPDSDAHKKEHADLIKQIQGIRRDYETDGPRAVTIPVMSFLANWVTNHILGADMRYRPHLVAKGVR